MYYAIILSGGIGTRMKMNGFPKQYIEVNGKPILIYTLERFENCREIDGIIIVAAKEWHDQIRKWLIQRRISKFLAFALPGEQRQESILYGLRECLRFNPSENDVVIIHDAVRPLVSERLITECINNAKQYGGCMPILPVNDTIYQSIDGKDITSLLDRKTLFAGQSPEAFFLLEYLKLNEEISREELNAYKGTSEIAFKNGINIRLIPGENTNYKITTVEDLERFRLNIENGASEV
ncbi:MAG: 2-C-methyl-D-erythritol 4-phosphate cytidylyltransferase [Lachnospiraceae bacterium]|nr:2-C-methyl-D-erythritol 4-phosphate cytidylyltransferase [Lachnospiraceae bacterium]